MNARDHAFSQLVSAQLPGWHDAPAAQHRATESPTDPRDRALGDAITTVVTKNLLLLRHLMRHYAGRNLTSIDVGVQIIIAIGLAQLRFFTRVPASAAVDEAVEQAKRLRFGKAGGFVNALLRRATREPDAPLPKITDPEQYARVVLSTPPDLFNRLEKLMGVENAIKLCVKHNTEAPTLIRLADGVPLRHLQEPPAGNANVTFTPAHRAGFYVADGAIEKDYARWSLAGLAQVQDLTSALVVVASVVSSAKRVLDRCCGVGTKTLQLAAAAPGAEIVAMDSAAWRIERLNNSLSHRQITNVHTHVASMMSHVPDAGLFDYILIDAPCSNSGVIIRRPEARYRQDARALASLAELQQRILFDTIPHLAPGGTLVYSTCSIWDDENGDVISALCAANADLKVIELKTTKPSLSDDPTQHHDGGYRALLRREASTA